MKALLAGSVALLALTAALGQVSAADLGRVAVPVAPVVMAPPYVNWAGLYLGAYGGYGWGSSQQTNVLGASMANYNTAGGLFGGTLGYNWQFGPWVLGLEGDGGWAGISGSSNALGVSYDSNLTWQSTIRGRVGYAIERFLPYVTGGAAFGGVSVDAGNVTNTTTRTGYSVGAGLEYAIDRNWSAKLEYLYVDLGSSQTVNAPTAINSIPFRANEFRVGINYRFN